MKKVVPSLTQIEGTPLDRPVYFFTQPTGVSGIVKKGINPKAKAILEDILGKQAAEEYSKAETQKISKMEEDSKDN